MFRFARSNSNGHHANSNLCVPYVDVRNNLLYRSLSSIYLKVVVREVELKKESLLMLELVPCTETLLSTTTSTSSSSSPRCQLHRLQTGYSFCLKSCQSGFCLKYLFWVATPFCIFNILSSRCNLVFF